MRLRLISLIGHNGHFGDVRNRSVNRPIADMTARDGSRFVRRFEKPEELQRFSVFARHEVVWPRPWLYPPVLQSWGAGGNPRCHRANQLTARRRTRFAFDPARLRRLLRRVLAGSGVA